MSSPRRKATYDDLSKVPEPFVAEIVDGELFVSPRPAVRHALATSAIGSPIFDRFHGPLVGALRCRASTTRGQRRPGDPERPGGWWILDEPELHLAEDVLVPDLAGWRRERLPSLPDVVGVTVAPDWVCEVVSPSTGTLDRRRKMPIYAREGVAHLWLVESLRTTVEVYRLERSAWVGAGTHTGAIRARIPPFETIELDLTRWWQRD